MARLVLKNLLPRCQPVTFMNLKPREFIPCGLVPTFNNPATIRTVVENLRRYLPNILVVDDGSAEPAKSIIQKLASEKLAQVIHLSPNQGKGVAVKKGFEIALQLGFSHCLQIDADGQHNIEDIPRFLEKSQQQPNALILGIPQFDATAPASRMYGRKITTFWIRIETGNKCIEDGLCGFRVYPLTDALRARIVGKRMDFDAEIIVRMSWNGVPIVQLPTRVQYLRKEEGGVSHFRMFYDNVLISWMHTRLTTRRLVSRLFSIFGQQP